MMVYYLRFADLRRFVERFFGAAFRFAVLRFFGAALRVDFRAFLFAGIFFKSYYLCGCTDNVINTVVRATTSTSRLLLPC